MQTVRIAAAQTVEFREDVGAALTCVADVAARAEAQGVALLCFPEGFLQGYLTEKTAARRNALDLKSPEFEAVLNRLPKTGPMIVMGMIEADGGRLFNTAIVVDRGAVIGRYRKTHLLRGERAFDAGHDYPVFEVAGLRFGINICCDTNFPEAAQELAGRGASLIVCPANNMLRRETAEAFRDMHNSARGDRCRETGLWLLSADVTGERDGRVSWGPTAVLNPGGEVVAQAPLEEAGWVVFDIPATGEGREDSPRRGAPLPRPADWASVFPDGVRMGRFRKKPVVIDAVHFTLEIAHNGWPPSVLQENPWLDEALREGAIFVSKTPVEGRPIEPPFMLIRTLEGDLSGMPGDWIIRGVKGELYACKPDVFAVTYELA